MFLYNHSQQTASPEDFAMIDEFYAEMDMGQEGLMCEAGVQCDNYEGHKDQRRRDQSMSRVFNPIESYSDENGVEFIEDKDGHVVIQSDESDCWAESPRPFAGVRVSVNYPARACADHYVLLQGYESVVRAHLLPASY